MTRPLDTDEITAIYDDLVDTYELEWSRRGHRSMHLAYYDDDHQAAGEAAINTMRLLSETAGVASGDRVLDIGCGAGEDAVWNVRAHDATVVGVDIGERQVELARETAETHEVADSVQFARDDFHELSTVANDSIDLVWALEALSHSPELPRALAQARRVLVDDGRLAVADIFLRGPTDDDRVTAVEEAFGLRMGSIDSFEKTLRAAGFEQVDVADRTDGVRQCTENRRQFARYAHLAGRLLGPLGPFSDRQMTAFRGSSRMHELVTDGIVGYYVVTATLGD